MKPLWYEGQFQNNQPDGVGTLKFKNRAMFQGAFSQGKITNYGVFTYPLNTNTEILSYKGQISNDGVANGLGEMQYKDGSKYHGFVTNGEITGFGTFTFAQNDTFEREFYRGEVVDGEIKGQGHLHYKNNQIYIGELINGQPHGSGSFINKVGIEIMKGTWENGYFLNEGNLYPVNPIMIKKSNLLPLTD